MKLIRKYFVSGVFLFSRILVCHRLVAVAQISRDCLPNLQISAVIVFLSSVHDAFRYNFWYLSRHTNMRFIGFGTKCSVDKINQKYINLNNRDLLHIHWTKVAFYDIHLKNTKNISVTQKHSCDLQSIINHPLILIDNFSLLLKNRLKIHIQQIYINFVMYIYSYILEYNKLE